MPYKAAIILSHAYSRKHGFSSRHIKRMQKGLELIKNHSANILITTAGKGKLFNQSTTPLGQLTKQWLIKHGAKKEQVLVEDKSLNTVENAKYSLQIMEKYKINSAAIITSWPHIYRTKKIFNQLNPAHKYDFSYITSDYFSGVWTIWDLIWETAGWVKLLITKRIEKH